MSKNLYLVERLVVEYQLVAADSEEQAIYDAIEYGEWDRENLEEGDELYYGEKAKFLRTYNED